MNTSTEKKPLIYIGLILFVAIAVIGVVTDFIVGTDGLIAIAAVCLAFLILAAFLAIEAISRRKEEKKALMEEFPDEPPVPLDSQRFLRHVEPEEAGGSEAEDIIASAAAQIDDEDVMRSASARRFVSRGQSVTREPENQLPDDDEIFTPVMRITAPGEVEEPLEDDFAETAEPESDYEYADEAEAQEAAAEPEAAPEAESEPAAPAAAPQEAGAVAPVPMQFAQGQSLESFYAAMSEDDILYRDCVEVWAADAKPAVLRLMKYVEGIEDKQTAALFGRECEYINAMIDRIQCFTQLEYVDESLELKKCNFATLVKDCLKRFSPFFMEKRLGLLWKGLDIDVMTDRRWFIFALTQVIFNSVEFTPEGGKIAISAKREDNYIDLIVDDSGKGISPEEMPYIFVAGYMGDDSPNEAGRRTGMGLFIARSVLNKMGGDVFAESNPGKGTRIIMRLPVIEPAE
ncbi:MAG: ATP-binding protein [Clostridia bacterium]|nr:ATP-binding protein [Clostridia bacterium]